LKSFSSDADKIGLQISDHEKLRTMLRTALLDAQSKGISRYGCKFSNIVVEVTHRSVLLRILPQADVLPLDAKFAARRPSDGCDMAAGIDGG
jgi:hypothetical protein